MHVVCEGCVAALGVVLERDPKVSNKKRLTMN